MKSVFDFFTFGGNYFALFIVSMIPLIELRGSVVLGAAIGMPWLPSLLISIVGNILPVPFLIIFGKKILNWLKRTKTFSNAAHKYEQKLLNKSDKVQKYSAIGLYLFVAIPLPGTGAWSGSVLAALLDMNLKDALPSIIAGVITAGIIMTLGSYGFINILSIFS